MTKKSAKLEPNTDPNFQIFPNDTGDTFQMPQPAVQECIIAADRQALEIARLKRTVVLKSAETALAENKAAEAEYKYLILQIYLKYGMTVNDGLDEATGNILRNANPNRQG